MIQLGKALISLDIVEKEFACDYAKCKGVCCIEGDSGAPLTDEEISTIEKDLPAILPYLSRKNKKVLKRDGIWYKDEEGEKVTTLVENAECAFVITDESGMLSCAIERAHEDGKCELPKPISCHLYPIRIRSYQDYEGLNYDTWHICKDAVCKGQKEKTKVYQFAKSSLIRKYGQNWYNELEQIALQWQQQNNS